MSTNHPELSALVGGGTRWRRLEHAHEVGSTNDLVAERARAGEPPGLVLLAEHQSEGRGRRGRPWVDMSGRSLTFSCLAVAPQRPTLVSLAAGIAVVDGLRRFGAAPTLKWPNDILLEERKCGGVLSELVAQPPRVVIGIGVDVDWRGVVRDGDARDWTSVAEILDRSVDRWHVLGAVLRELDRWLRRAEESPRAFVDDYRERCATIGARVRVTGVDGVVREGRAESVDDDGALVLRTDEGTATISSGDLAHLRPVRAGHPPQAPPAT